MLTIPKDLLKRITGIDTKDLFWARQVQMVGAFPASSRLGIQRGAPGERAHRHIHRHQEVANVAELQAAITYVHQLERRLLLVHHASCAHRRD